jgi:Domain of unknown function (DUF4105)
VPGDHLRATMKFVRKLLRLAWRTIAFCIWWGLALWTALAVFFTAPVSSWLASVLAIAVVGLYFTARREPFHLVRWFKVPWSEKRLSTAALAVSALFATYYFGFVKPDPNQDWAPEQARQPHVEIVGNKVQVSHVRNFTWHSATDFTPGFYDRVYDLDALNSMYYIVASMPKWKAVAHVFVCFGFSDGQHVAVSVEGRRRNGQTYRVIPSMFRRFQMIYVIGDERDVVGLRGAIWKDPVYFYPARTTNERKRAIFLDMMQRAHSLEEHPEFYNLIFNNCMNNITYHLRRLGGRPLPHDLQVLLTGLSDRVAHRLGYIDTDLPFEKARQAFRIDQWMQTTPLDDGFSQRLRETLVRQAAEQGSQQLSMP